MPLTDIGIRSAKPGTKIVKLSDGGGLQLWVTPDGAKRWRLAYRFAGGQKTLALGVYPATGLRNARDARDAAKRLLNEGKIPTQHRRAKILKGRRHPPTPSTPSPPNFWKGSGESVRPTVPSQNSSGL